MLCWICYCILCFSFLKYLFINPIIIDDPAIFHLQQIHFTTISEWRWKFIKIVRSFISLIDGRNFLFNSVWSTQLLSMSKEFRGCPPSWFYTCSLWNNYSCISVVLTILEINWCFDCDIHECTWVINFPAINIEVHFLYRMYFFFLIFSPPPFFPPTSVAIYKLKGQQLLYWGQKWRQ